MIVIIFLVIAPFTSVGLLCLDPNRKLTYKESGEGDNLCLAVIDERCEDDYSFERTFFGMANPYNYGFDKKLRSRALNERNFCALVVNSSVTTIQCFCDTDYCSTHFETLRNLWKGSGDYDPNEKSSKCLDLLTNESTTMHEKAHKVGIICPKCGNVSIKLWNKEDRCKVVLDCNRTTDKEDFNVPKFDVSHVRYSDNRGKTYCFVNNKTTIVCVCDGDFCTGDAAVVQDIWKKSPDYIAGSTLDQCMQKFLKDLPHTVMRPPPEEKKPGEPPSDGGHFKRSSLNCIIGTVFVYLLSYLIL